MRHRADAEPFLLLVLVNLGFAAWYLWIVEPVTDVGAIRNSAVPSISLVSELEKSANPPNERRGCGTARRGP